MMLPNLLLIHIMAIVLVSQNCKKQARLFLFLSVDSADHMRANIWVR